MLETFLPISSKVPEFKKKKRKEKKPELVDPCHSRNLTVLILTNQISGKI